MLKGIAIMPGFVGALYRNWSLRILTLIGLVLLGVSSGFAAPEERGDRLEVLIGEAKEKNQQLISAFEEAERFKIRIPLLEKVSDPLVGFYYLDFPLGNITSGWTAKENQEEIQANAPVAVRKRGRGKILTGLDMVEDQALWYQYLYEDLILQVVSQIRQNYYNLYFLNRIIQVNTESLQTFDVLIEAGNVRYAVGIVRQTEVLRAQTERYRLQAELTRLRQKRIEIESRLNYLSGRLATHEITPQLEVELDSDNLPELHYSVGNLISGLYKFKPMIKGYQALGARFNAMHRMIGMRFNIESRDEAKFEAQRGLRAISAKEKDLYFKLIADLNSTAGRLQENRELAGFYGKVLLPQDRQLFEASLADFRVGNAEFSGPLNALLGLNRDQNLYYQALADYMVAMARLEELSGVPMN
jgi:hypothetical protein